MRFVLVLSFLVVSTAHGTADRSAAQGASDRFQEILRRASSPVPCSSRLAAPDAATRATLAVQQLESTRAAAYDESRRFGDWAPLVDFRRPYGNTAQLPRNVRVAIDYEMGSRSHSNVFYIGSVTEKPTPTYLCTTAEGAYPLHIPVASVTAAYRVAETPIALIESHEAQELEEKAHAGTLGLQFLQKGQRVRFDFRRGHWSGWMEGTIDRAFADAFSIHVTASSDAGFDPGRNGGNETYLEFQHADVLHLVDLAP